MKNLLLLLLLSTSLYCFSQKGKIYLGADLSYVNEVEDGGAFYKSNGKRVEPYHFFKEKGCNLIRLRIWHSPEWNSYSGFEDVKKSIKRAKDQKMEVLLTFQYSDTWTGPDYQNIPKAWKEISDVKILGDSVYQYTLQTLLKLNRKNLLPDMVQVGNEINVGILLPKGKPQGDIDWDRNSFLINKGIMGVREASKIAKKKIQIMLHIAQPENALYWFDKASKNNILDYEWIGISYHPFWSTMDFDNLEQAITTLTSTYEKKLLVVETSYPYSLVNIDQNNNILNDNALLDAYPPTPYGQRRYMIDLTKATLNSGGNGVVYWEPAWVTSSCKTPWGIGSSWDNATFFDASNSNEALPVFDFFDLKNYSPNIVEELKYPLILVLIIVALFFLMKIRFN